MCASGERERERELRPVSDIVSAIEMEILPSRADDERRREGSVGEEEE